MSANTAQADVDIHKAAAAAGRLAERLKAGETYQAFQQRVETLQGDSKALGVLQDFQNEQQRIAIARQYGEVSQDELEELQHKEAAMMDHPVLKAFFDAQQSLIDELSEVNASISAGLGFDFAKLAKPAEGCGCGGSC